ncbi:hypothetical protein Taro_010827 [Colocasia esculenta]|uniref:Uncharacterized protein n=1 Tax=Colocasia esculenta TaxID=4460 RepID=A0A843U860_COLES|nr:hypothetical protein [Colocasia esculenta]
MSSDLDTLTLVFELYVRLRERRQRAATCVCGCALTCSTLVVGGTDTSRHTGPQLVLLPVPHFRELGPESLKVPGMGLQCVRLQLKQKIEQCPVVSTQCICVSKIVHYPSSLLEKICPVVLTQCTYVSTLVDYPRSMCLRVIVRLGGPTVGPKALIGLVPVNATEAYIVF